MDKVYLKISLQTLKVNASSYIDSAIQVGLKSTLDAVVVD